MQVTTINNDQSFSGGIRETKKGNKYEKSNEGKKIYPLIAAGTTAIAMPVLMRDKVLEKFVKMPEIAKSFEKSEIKEFEKVVKTSKFKAITIGSAIVGALLGGLIDGVIVDAFANHTRRKDADSFAKTGEIPQKTNKGKLICGGIGLGVGSINALRYLALNKTGTISELEKTAKNSIKEVNIPKTVKKALTGKEKMFGLAFIPSAIISWGILGTIYDYSVNKSRAKTADVAYRKANAEAKLDAKIQDKVNEVLENKNKPQMAAKA